MPLPDLGTAKPDFLETVRIVEFPNIEPEIRSRNSTPRDDGTLSAYQWIENSNPSRLAAHNATP
jgi:hypothetical protein